MHDLTLDEKWDVPSNDLDDSVEELALEFDASQEPDSIWEWNGDSWVAVAA
jgi:hypothetical protein